MNFCVNAKITKIGQDWTNFKVLSFYDVQINFDFTELEI